MKKNWFIIIALASLLSGGCGAFSKTIGSMGSDRPPNHWDGTGYKRSTGVGTGIDPQAREIEQRLGYSNEGLKF